MSQLRVHELRYNFQLSYRYVSRKPSNDTFEWYTFKLHIFL